MQVWILWKFQIGSVVPLDQSHALSMESGWPLCKTKRDQSSLGAVACRTFDGFGSLQRAAVKLNDVWSRPVFASIIDSLSKTSLDLGRLA